MTIEYQHDQDRMPSSRAGYTRQDMRRRDIVNHAILVQENSNTVAALEYLKAHDIAPGVIARVLLAPLQRRLGSHH